MRLGTDTEVEIVNRVAPRKDQNRCRNYLPFLNSRQGTEDFNCSLLLYRCSGLEQSME